MTSRFLTPELARDLVDSVDVFLFDCDGVIWRGETLTEGVISTMEMLRSRGKKVVFVTNNSTRSRKQYVKKFQALGLEVDHEEIFSSSFAAAFYLKSVNFDPDKKVYVIGEEGIREELSHVGITSLGGPEDGEKRVQLSKDLFFEHDEKVGAVVVGLDRSINFYKMQYATLCIKQNPGCLFIATNEDAASHLTNAQEWPGAGAMVGAIRGSCRKEPIVVGKPSSLLMNLLLERFQVAASRMCMVGDRLDTDILFAINGGCHTLLVFTGVTSLTDLHDPDNKIQPEFYTNKVSDLMEVL